MSSPLAPLLPRDGASQIEERLRPFRQQGVIGSVDVHVVDHLGVLVGESDPDVLLALALAVRAPRNGHICVDLTDVQHLAAPVEPGDPPEAAESAQDVPTAEPLGWPATDSWIQRVASSPLVRRPGQDRVTPFVLDGSVLYSDRYFTYQSRLAEELRARVSTSRSLRDRGLLQRGLATLFSPLDDHAFDRQKLGAAMALLRGFTVISGGPGTGKTFTVRSVLALLWAQWAIDHDPNADVPGPRVALAAPTGKAAARMQEALSVDLDPFLDRAATVLPNGRTREHLRAFLTTLQPSTIHRLLRFNPAQPSRFRHDAENPLPHEVVVIDEASMIDFALMAKLVDAIAPDARLVLLGDKHQLASVEAGTVLADVCGPSSVTSLTLSDRFQDELRAQAGVDVRKQPAIRRESSAGPHDAIVLLDRSWRFRPSSGIGQFAKTCLADDFDPEKAADLLANDRGFPDATMVAPLEKEILSEQVAKIVVDGYRPYLERLLAGPQTGESLEALHASVIDRFGAFRILCAHRNGRSGAEGMNREAIRLLENDKKRKRLRGFNPVGAFWVGRPILILRNDYVVQRFNGDVGIVVKDGKGKLTVAFPKRGGVTYLPPSRLPEHQTVFAMTIHKSQGSEFDETLVMLPNRESPILTKELVYTAVTRAKQRMTLVGRRDLLVGALGRSVRRASGLEGQLWKAK